MKTGALPAVNDRIRELLRERRYAEAADLATKVADSLGIEAGPTLDAGRPPAPVPAPVRPAIAAGTGGAESVGSRLAAIFEADR